MSLSAERFQRIESIFHEALAVAPAGRKACLAELCSGDSELQAEVEALLAAHAEEERLNTTMRDGSSREAGMRDEPRRMGPYALDKLIGRGGMGAVFLAHRADGQFEQKVAIKLIDLPLATEVFRERFRMERQILASLHHPYIARLFDGGVSAEGDLYLVMEYVDGVPIHRYCKEHGLKIRERLELFRKVCEAVQFAHQNLVVHRDLKPDNILVAEDGTPRLLDFGTAKLISQANPGGDLTMQGYQSFTPQYASPEQVLGNPITTASDTYSLGVLLYLLLTDTVPYELKELTTAELVRVICQEPPRKPTTPHEKGGRLDADLDAILAKALRKESQERYRTAERMGADIANYLAGRTVGARKGSFRYRAGKFIRRNRWAIAGAGVIFLVLVTGVLGVLWQARIANEERRKAEARSADLRQLSNSLLSELADAIKQLPGSTGVQQLLVTRVLEHLDRMARDAQGDRQTQLDMVDAYARLGNIQGNAYDQNLGDPKGGLASLNKALAIAKPLAAADAKPDALRSLAFVEQSRSEIMYHMGNTEEAVMAMKEAVASFAALIADPHAKPELLGEAASAYGSLGDQLGAPGTPSLGDRAGAIAWYRKTIEVDNRALGIDPHYLRCLRGLAIMQIKLGTVETETDPAQALKDFQLGMERVKALPESQQASMLVTRIRYMLMRKEANAYSELGEYAKAIPLYEATREEQEKVLAADAKDLRAMADVEIDLDDEAQSYENAADEQLQSVSKADKRRNLEMARQLMERAMRLFDQMLKHDAGNTLWQASGAMTVMRIGMLNAQLGDRPVDVAAVTKAMDSLHRMASDANATPATLSEAADAFVEVRPEHLRDARFALVCAQREAAGAHGETPARLLALSMAYRGLGDVANARSAAQKGLAMMTPPAQGVHEGRIYRQLSLASQGKDLNLVTGGADH